MKITINVECTPEEARTSLGLPDVQPMQRALMDQLQERMSGYLSAMDPEVMVKNWLPLSFQNWEQLQQLQRLFWAQVTGAGRSSSDKPGG